MVKMLIPNISRVATTSKPSTYLFLTAGVLVALAVAGIAGWWRTTQSNGTQGALVPFKKHLSTDRQSSAARDRYAARVACRSEVERMVKDAAVFDNPNTYQTRVVEPTVMLVEIGATDSGGSGLQSRVVFHCRATDQNGGWEAESVTEGR